MNRYDYIIIGGGIVGLSTGHKLLEKNPNLKILIIEKENDVSKHQTGNNSGVIHSGIYYKPGSLKALNCKRGYRYLIEFCEKNNIPYEICGKIIVATEEKELPKLQDIYERGIQNGLTGLKILRSEEIKDYEPYCTGIKAINVPQAGIVDFKLVSDKIAVQIQNKGSYIHFREKVTEIKEKTDYAEVITNKEVYQAKAVISCAGLESDRIAKMTHRNLNIRIVPFRGEYYKIKEERKHLIKNLIYPVPDPQFPFLGVHFTRRIEGIYEAGPNAVFAFAREGYKKSDINIKDLYESMMWTGFFKIAFKYWKIGLGEFYRSYSKSAFVRALQRLVPEIKKDDLEKGGAGVRAQACDNKGNLADDFLIVKGKRVIHICNAPSPAATSSFSIGETIAGEIFNR